VEGT